jgi:hypothetical protein
MMLTLAVVGMLGSSHGIASAAPAASADPPTADTTKFLLAGIRPHMTEAQAHAVFAESRTEAIRAAYNAAVLPPLKTSF